jgi:hypothetical protein
MAERMQHCGKVFPSPSHMEFGEFLLGNIAGNIGDDKTVDAFFKE